MLKRKIYSELLDWKNRRKNEGLKKCLLIKGARQVGKSYIVNEFGKNEYKEFVYVNCDSNERVRELFEHDFNINRIIRGLSALSGKSIQKRQTLIFFDEIVEPNSDTQDLSDKLNLKFPKCGIFVYPDPTCKKRQTNAMAGVTDLSILKKNGFTAIVPPHPYATKDKYNSVNTGLLNAKGDRHIFVVRDS